jgi:hypothetical protein
MKRITVMLGICLFVAMSAFAINAKDTKKDSGSVTATGWVTDAACAKSGDKSKMSDAACVKKCAADGKYVIVTDGDNKVWAVENSEMLKGHEGHHVKVTGHPNADAGTIHLASVSMVDDGKKKDKAMNK